MTSRLKKAFFRFTGRSLAKDYHQEGDTVTLTHSFYGPLRLFHADQGISRWLFDGKGIWEAEIIELFRKHFPRGRNIVDAGANLGLHTIALAKMAQNSETVYAFEPHPEVYELFAANCSQFSNVKCFNKALSDSQRVFHMPSIKHAVNAGGCNLLENNVGESYSVESVTLDQLEIPNVGLMKIDVEGHEGACIRGATNTIRRDKPILVVEIMGGTSRDTASTLAIEAIDRQINSICELGYRCENVSSHDYLFTPA